MIKSVKEQYRDSYRYHRIMAHYDEFLAGVTQDTREWKYAAIERHKALMRSVNLCPDAHRQARESYYRNRYTEDLLGITFRSLRNQKYPSFEIPF